MPRASPFANANVPGKIVVAPGPNMKRNADDFDIQSEVGKGTRISMRFNLA